RLAQSGTCTFRIKSLDDLGGVVVTLPRRQQVRLQPVVQSPAVDDAVESGINFNTVLRFDKSGGEANGLERFHAQLAIHPAKENTAIDQDRIRRAENHLLTHRVGGDLSGVVNTGTDLGVVDWQQV